MEKGENLCMEGIVIRGTRLEKTPKGSEAEKFGINIGIRHTKKKISRRKFVGRK